MKKLLIIDGHNLLFQMFFGMPSRIVNKDGKAIQGTLGFVGALLKIIRMTTPTHVVVLFDGEHENSRTELLPDYKSNRTGYIDVPDENNPFSQIDDIYRALDYLAIRHTEISDFETDDVVASYALAYGESIEIIISSFDSDFFQLINSNISILRYRGKNTILCDVKYIQEKFGILPEQYVDFKSLTGDNCDNIKGAKLVGPKTAQSLINQFGSLENIIKNCDAIEKPAIKQSIKDSVEQLAKNYKLIKLHNFAKRPFDLDELEYLYNGITTTNVLTGIHLK